MSEPVDVVAEMRGSVRVGTNHAYRVDAISIEVSRLNRWADEVERLQALPEKVNELAAKWLVELHDCSPVRKFAIADCRIELLAMLSSPQKEKP